MLRSDGRLIFLVNSCLMSLCTPDENGVAATNQLLRPLFGLHRVEWPDEPGVEFHLSTATGFDCCDAQGSRSQDPVEVRPDENATTRYPFVTLDWARAWPCEEIWKVRKRA